MRIYLVVNVYNLKHYDPSMLDQEEDQVLPSIENLAPYAQVELAENIFLQQQCISTRHGKHDLSHIGLC
jgi:hypothetical protein